MKLILVRHAIAEDQEEFARTEQPDDLRPLTDAGRSRMKRAARGLQAVVDQLDLIATSPLTRAVQTAEILGKEYGKVAVVVAESLAPHRQFDEFLTWLGQLDDVDTVAAVGHEPHMSSLASWLLTGSGTSFFEMKKGSAMLLDFDQELRAGGAKLRWFLTPSQLRSLSD
jgi:phosphohistidine phosphatase